MRNGTANPSSSPHTVAIVIYDGMSPFEFAAACDVFGSLDWSATLGVPWYRFYVCSATAGLLTTDAGFRVEAPYRLGPLKRAGTVIVPPTESLESVPVEVLDALRRAHARGARILSLCTGAFVLAAAGLLDGRRATTHWSESDRLARLYPRVTVDPDVLYVDDGDILTSAGSAASIDLCLHVVRRDFGTEIATQLARQMVVPPHREGGQAQYIDMPMSDFEESDLFGDTLAWLQEHLDDPVSIDDLASRSAMSPRTFARRFVASTGTTPYQWLLRQRIQLAQRLLETGDLPIETVAGRCGFGTAANLRKHFHRAVRTSPQSYRRTFRDRQVC
jgi:AraC family transcriptional regulator, transcriptional activator FtrA